MARPAWTRDIVLAERQGDRGCQAQLTDNLKAQVNIENLLDERYYGMAHNDNILMPGSPRPVRVSLTGKF